MSALLNRGGAHGLSLRTVEAVAAACGAEVEVSFRWHGGEPVIR
ncbi:MAG: hypothetical protein ABW167_07735 [Baekduia sp.]